MRFMAFAKSRPEDMEKVLAKLRKLQEERKKFPDKYPKILFSSHIMEYNTVTIYEAENEEQLINFYLHYLPEVQHKFVPMFRVGKVLELSGKMQE